jgi:hypothetical protein
MQLLKSEDGAITAEYAIATLAGVAFAGLMLLVLKSEEVRSAIQVDCRSNWPWLAKTFLVIMGR